MYITFIASGTRSFELGIFTQCRYFYSPGRHFLTFTLWPSYQPQVGEIAETISVRLYYNMYVCICALRTSFWKLVLLLIHVWGDGCTVFTRTLNTKVLRMFVHGTLQSYVHICIYILYIYVHSIDFQYYFLLGFFFFFFGFSTLFNVPTSWESFISVPWSQCIHQSSWL